MAIILSPSTVYQTIDGFGLNTGYGIGTASSGRYDMASMTSSEADHFFGTLGLSIARCGCFSTTGSILDSVGMQLAAARGARVIALVMQPGGRMGPDAWYSGSALMSAHYQDAADLCVTALQNMAGVGVTPTWLDTTNEPDVTGAFPTAADHLTYTKILGATLAANGFGSVKLKGPDLAYATNFVGWADAIVGDAQARGYFSVLSWHSYGSGNLSGPYAAGPANGLSVWMSEWCDNQPGDFDASINSGLTLAGNIHAALVTTSANAYCWHLFRPDGLLGAGEIDGGGNLGLLGLNGEHTKREYTLAQFAKFVRPGFVRIGCSGAPSGVSASAYMGSGIALAVVLINSNLTGTAISLTGVTTPALRTWVTDATRDMAQQPDLSVSGGVASYTLPAQSVVTLEYPVDYTVVGSTATISVLKAPDAVITVTDTPAVPLFGTASSPMNRPISAWEADIKAHYSTSSIVDSAATADVATALAATSASERLMFTTGQDSFPVYYAQSGDTGYTLRRGPTYSYGQAYSLLDNPNGVGTVPTMIRVPTGAHVYAHLDDQHLTVVDVDRNRITACYASSDVDFGTGFVAGGFVAQFRGTDLYRGTDATILAAQAAATRYAYSGSSSSYPTSGAGLCGLGAGVPSGAISSESAANGDTNGPLSPHGVIMPEDFDDTGWQGEAVGTLHHALYCVVRTDSAYGCVWPYMNPGGGTSGKSLKNGQIIRLDPAFVIPVGTAAWARRVLRTMQVYGCVVADWSAAQFLKMSGQGNWSGLGPARAGNPWAITGEPWSAEANAAYATATAAGVIYLPTITGLTSAFQAILPHGAAY